VSPSQSSRRLTPVQGLAARTWAADALRFLAEASSVLSSSLEYEVTLEQVSRLAVPYLADWCVVDVLEPDGSVRQISVAHVDLAKEQLAMEMRDTYPIDRGATLGVAKVLRTGRPEFYPEIPDNFWRSVARSPEHLELLLGFHVCSCLCVPMVARGWVLGVISFCTTESERRYTQDDLAVAMELAGRAAIAVDNARLYEAEERARWVAEREAKRMSGLYSVASSLARAHTSDELWEAIIRPGLSVMGAMAGA
jgi:GAF domain-containing protein